MTQANSILEEVKRELDHDLELGLALSKAEGNLRFLAEQSNQENWKGSVTEGMAILDALNAVQKARKEWQEIIFAKRLKKVLKAKGLGVCVLKGFPVCSSARKLVWHSDWSILKKILPLIGLPWLLKSRNACRFWYERPNHSRNG